MPSLRSKQRRDTETQSDDERFMRQALSLARKGEGRVEPNPMVGCVITRGSRVIGQGYHHRFGGPHAEVLALRNAATSVRGATIFVTLEPCCHTGKTPPCTQALLEAGVARVVVAIRDPNATVHGRGLRQLRKAGIVVDVDTLKSEAAEVIAPFAVRCLLDRPYIIAKWAQSLDGKIATRTGDSRWISNESSRKLVHRLRARVDAIVVGMGTVRSDNPLLTARQVPLRRTAARVVLDSQLRVPDTCRLVRTAKSTPTIIATSRVQSKSAKAERLRQRGVRVIACAMERRPREPLALAYGVSSDSSRSDPRPQPRIRLSSLLRELAAMDMTNVLVEGGSQVLTAFLEAELVDEAWVFTSPKLVGGAQSPGAFEGRGVRTMAGARVPYSVRIQTIQDDVLHRLRLTVPPVGHVAR